MITRAWARPSLSLSVIVFLVFRAKIVIFKVHLFIVKQRTTTTYMYISTKYLLRICRHHMCEFIVSNKISNHESNNFQQLVTNNRRLNRLIGSRQRITIIVQPEKSFQQLRIMRIVPEESRLIGRERGGKSERQIMSAHVDAAVDIKVKVGKLL